MLETEYDEQTKQALKKANELLSDYAKQFQSKYGHFKVHEYQKAWLNDETRAAILYAKTRIVSLATPRRILICEDEFIFKIENFQRRMFESKPTDHTNQRDHGWYNKFNKTNKRKNFATK